MYRRIPRKLKGFQRKYDVDGVDSSSAIGELDWVVVRVQMLWGFDTHHLPPFRYLRGWTSAFAGGAIRAGAESAGSAILGSFHPGEASLICTERRPTCQCGALA